MKRWLRVSARRSGSGEIGAALPCQMFADADLVRRRYVDLLLVNTSLCSR